MKSVRTVLFAAVVTTVALSSSPAFATQDNVGPLQKSNLTGLHDFDPLVGHWKTHHRRLKERLAGSHEWIEFGGTFDFRLLMDGYANMDDSFFDMPGAPYRGIGLSAYDPSSGTWALWGLDSRNPLADMDPPVKGRFENGVGTFFSNDTFQGKPIRIRMTWSHMTKTSAHFEQAFSPDDGKTWETNWITDFQKVSDEPSCDAPSTPSAKASGLNAFDTQVGRWKEHHRRLKERLLNNHEWEEFEGTQTLWRTMGGQGNVDENFFRRPGNESHGVTVRAYDPKTNRWAIWWLDSRNPHGPLDPPVKGSFDEKGVGTFYADDTLRGKPIKVRFIWSKLTPTSAHWEQAFSADGGKTWETNWTTDFERAR